MEEANEVRNEDDIGYDYDFDDEVQSHVSEMVEE